MNYRHIYHAGNICDVVKHAVLTLLIKRLTQKESPLTVLDTHAGIGLYDLDDPLALKTNEAQSGIRKLVSAPVDPVLAPFLERVRAVNGDGVLRYYAGSPCLARGLLRAQDQLILCELHPDDARTLKRRFYGDTQTHIHQRDGYEALTALWPPRSGRGLVLIDPPFEQPDEFEKLTAHITRLYQHWTQGPLVVWYPVKDRPTLWRWHEAMRTSGIPKQLTAEFIYAPEARSDKLNGSGLLLINPPWQIEADLSALFQALHTALGTPHQESRITWLVGETPGP